MDLNDLKPKDTVTVELKHPGDFTPLLMPDETPMSVTVYTPYAQKYKDALYAQTDKRLKKSASGKVAQMDSHAYEKASTELLADTISDWKIFLNKQEVKFSKDAAVSLLQDLPWIKTQIQEAQADLESFFTK